MTPRERAEQAACLLEMTTGRRYMSLVAGIEQAIIAAVEADRKARPHEFVGRLDRWCDVCGEPDRDNRHLFSREYTRNSVEAEREACALQLEDRAKFYNSQMDDAEIAVVLMNEAGRIRARSTASSNGGEK